MTQHVNFFCVGIDPGAQGAIVMPTTTGLVVCEMPTIQRKTSKGLMRERTDVQELLRIMHSFVIAGARTAIIESVWGVKGQGAGAAAALGHNIGCIETACAVAGLTIERVSPVRWKYDVGILKQGKAGAVVAASQLFPDAATDFKTVRGKRSEAQAEGNAEAALIAAWGAGYRHLPGTAAKWAGWNDF